VPAFKDTETCRVASRRRRDSRVTSMHGENVSFCRVTANHTRLESNTVLRGTAKQAGRTAVCQVEPSSSIVQYLRRISHSKPHPFILYVHRHSLPTCEPQAMSTLAVDRSSRTIFLVRAEPKLTLCRQSEGGWSPLIAGFVSAPVLSNECNITNPMGMAPPRLVHMTPL
jgi:hypothetical protein